MLIAVQYHIKWYRTVDRTSLDAVRTGGPSMSETDVNAKRGGTDFGKPKGHSSRCIRSTPELCQTLLPMQEPHFYLHMTSIPYR